MYFSNETRKLAYNIVLTFSKFDPLYCKYILDIQHVSNVSLYEISASIMLDNKDYSYESNSVDNPAFESIMLPSLLSHLKDIFNKDHEEEFVQGWRIGILKYHYNTIANLLEDALDQYNFNLSEMGDH